MKYLSLGCYLYDLCLASISVGLFLHCSGFSPCCGFEVSNIISGPLSISDFGPQLHTADQFGDSFYLAAPHGIWDLPWPGLEPMPHAVEMHSLNHSTIREVQGTPEEKKSAQPDLRSQMKLKWSSSLVVSHVCFRWNVEMEVITSL